MTTLSEQKKALRKEIKAIKAHLSDIQKRQAIERVTDGLFLLPQINETRNIAIYNSLPDELGTKEIIEKLIAQKHRIFLPVITGNDIVFRQLTQNTTLSTANSYGINEPIDGDLLPIAESFTIIVPGIAFTKEGKRMGRGGGFYDRFFAQCKSNNNMPYKIGICYECQIVPDIPTEPFDINMDTIIFG